MALEASIVERLQELRRWQTEQQERLLQHQQEQRETLSREQVRMYEALGLSVKTTSGEKTDAKAESILQDSLDDENGGKIETKTKNYENMLKTSLIEDGDLSSPRHMSPQRRHELLHNFSPGLKSGDGNLHDLTSKKSPKAIAGGDENERFEPCVKNSPENGADPDGGNSTSNYPKRGGKTDVESETRKPRGIIPELLIEGVEPLPMDKPSNKSLMIDDIPLPSPKKDFHTLLEERLRESQYTVGNDGEGNRKPVKRPFLKKGQGLARFKLISAPENSTKQIRPRTMSLPSSVRMENSRGVKTNGDKSNEASKAAKKRATNCKTEKTQRKYPPVPSRAQSRLSLKNVQPPVRIRSKSMCNPREGLIPPDDRLREIDRFNQSSSDIESKTKREMEEVRIFELLEEKAENSSFCSTSSTVVALLQQSVQSTPLKAKNMNKNKISTLAHKNWRNEKEDANEDLLLAEIVYTTQSNSTVHNSSVAYKKQYENNFGQSVSKEDLQRGRNVPDKLQNDDSFDESSSDAICELPYGTDVDTNYDADFSRNEQNNYTNNKDFECQVNYEKNTSLHVRFSEYNEYKTIGLTDTSTISNESETQRHYSDERAWSDCSATTDSSEAEDFAPTVQHEKFKSPGSQGSLKNKPKAIQSKQTNGKTHKDTYYDQFHEGLTESQHEDEYSNENRSDYGIESEKKSYDYHREATDDDGSDSDSERNDDNKNSVADNEVSALADSTLVEEESCSVETQKENGLIFKSELLKTRLLELEREIEIFRKENIAVTTIKEKLQEERRALERSFKEKESRFEERKLKLENTLQEEKKRLIREKTALESRLKDAHAKSQQSKQERLEVQSLEDQLEELREEMNQKESRWNAAQARHRSQVRILQSENSKLKQEIEKLQITRKANTKARLNTKHIASSNTKAIHQINKQLESQKQPRRKQDSTSDEEEFFMQPMMEAMNFNEPQNDQEDYGQINSDGSRMIIYDRTQSESKNRNDIARKRDLYQNLLKDATIGLKEGEEATRKAVQTLETKKNTSRVNDQLPSAADEIEEEQNPIDANEILSRTGFDQRETLPACKANKIASKNSNDILERNANEENPLHNYLSSMESVRNKQATNRSEMKKLSNPQNNAKVDKQGIREVQHPDGRTEFWYPNGNVKKISADGTITKLIYYNGDVCESREDGSVKYFYATTRTWHTTMPDGLEILEYPDGQVERRSKDGTVEVSFPDGSVRILQSNGTEKWALADGTLVETSADGDKILILPNGQREIHTKDHKRREYPDGTVKLVYPDGSQETRYASGRVRLKDKDGNLLMDSHNQ